LYTALQQLEWHAQSDLPQMRKPIFNRSSDPPRDQQLFLIERDFLRALCQNSTLAELSSQVRSDLQNYPWQGSDHQTIFEAILGIGIARCSSLREQLAAQATLMGFPDINWNEYFEQASAADGESKRSVMELARELKATAREQ
jgi:hypothetical protein